MSGAEHRREVLEKARRVPIELLLDRHGISHRRGRGWPCPVCHQAKADNGCGVLRSDACRWHCFACGEGGTAVDVWLAWHGLQAGKLDAQAFEALEKLLAGHGEQVSVQRAVVDERPLLTAEQVAAYWRAYQKRPKDAARAWLASRGLPEGLAELVGVIDREGLLPEKRRRVRVGDEWVPMLEQGKSIIALPLSGPTGVKNMVLRGSTAGKAVTLNSGPGTTRENGLPLWYGDLERARKARIVFVVEGGPDWLTALALWLGCGVLGGFCADDFLLWHRVLADLPGRIVFVPHLDTLQWRCLTCRGGWRKVTRVQLAGGRCPECGGEVERRRPGIAVMQACMEQLGRGEWFPWRAVLDKLGIGLQAFLERGSSDLNDLVKPDGWAIPLERVRAACLA